MRQVGKVLAVALLLTAFASNTAHATAGWFNVKVEKAGMESGGRVFIRLTDTAAFPAFTGKWSMASDTIKKEILAIALTAITGDFLVEVHLDPDLSIPVINVMYLIK